MKEIKINNVMSGWGKRTGDGRGSRVGIISVRYFTHVPKNREGGKHPDYF